MEPDDKEKTTFNLDSSTYFYKAMPFELRNTDATYQRLVNKMFKLQIDQSMEVYVDDMLVKSTKRDDHICNLKESFGVLRSYEMKLNPLKCIVGVASGKFLGFMITN